jgi:glycosyltransferase involved in cell wall biosynthesis
MYPPGIGEPATQDAGRAIAYQLEGVSPYAAAAPDPYLGAGPYGPGLGAPPPAASQPLRVTHVGPNMLRGGVEMWLRGLIRYLDPRRVQVVRCLVSQPEHIDPRVAAEMGVPVAAGDRDSVRRAALDSDVLLCWGPGELAGWLEGCRPRLCVFVAHGEGFWTRHMLHRAAPVVDHVVAVSRSVEQALGVQLPVTRIPNGVDSSRLGQTRPRRAFREALGFRDGDFVLGFVGRFSDEKRPHLPLEAVALLPPAFKALLVGWGPLRGRLLDLANERLPGRYAFAMAGDDVGDYYAAMDALCLPSQEEGFALVILEAMMCGRPVIVTPVGCVPEVIEHRVNGLVVEGSGESIAAAAGLLARHPAWAAGLAEQGRAYAEEHGHARAMARRYEELLLGLWRDREGQAARRAVQ